MMDNRMKTMKYILAALLSAMALVSCNDWLTLGPIDYYGSESYWKTEANFDSYIDGMHKNMRDQAWTHTIVSGELRGDEFRLYELIWKRTVASQMADARGSTEPAPTVPRSPMRTSSRRPSTRTTPV